MATQPRDLEALTRRLEDLRNQLAAHLGRASELRGLRDSVDFFEDPAEHQRIAELIDENWAEFQIVSDEYRSLSYGLSVLDES